MRINRWGVHCAVVAASVCGSAWMATAAAPGTDGGLVLVYLRQFSFTSDIGVLLDESEVIPCLERAIRSTRPQQRLISFDQFRQIAFPQLSLDAAPRSPEYLSLILARPDIRQRLRAMGVRHLAYIGGVLEVERKGEIGSHWNRKSRLGASLIDLETMSATGRVEADARGTAWFAMAAVVLRPDAYTVGPACRVLGAKLTGYLEQQTAPLPESRGEP